MRSPLTSMDISRRPLRCAGQFALRLLVPAVVLTIVLTLAAGRADAVITPASTIDASSGVVDFGDAAMASDGTGAVVYRKLVGGVPHVFVARYTRQRWFPPIRVDNASPFAASAPRIAASRGGRLLVVWSQAYATLPDSTVRFRLMSASLAPGASNFGEQLAVDKDVRDGTGVDPSVAITPTGRAFVAYRVVTGDQSTTSYVPLRPRDVLAEIRVSFLDGRTWSSLGTVNRNRAATMRAPVAQNGPQLAATPTGNAIVAWQEPDVTTGVARIYARRIFATRLGNVLAVSPDSPVGQTTAEDFDGISVALTRLGGAAVAFRQAPPATGGSGARSQLLVNTMPLEVDDAGARFRGAQAIGSAVGEQLGVPAVAMDENDNFRVAFGADGGVRLVSGGYDRDPTAAELGGSDGAEVVTTIDPSGGGTAAWPARDASGGPAVTVRQDFPSGAFQTAVVGASVSGPVGSVRLGGSGLGDALIGFDQGAAGSVQIAAAVVKAPPADFAMRVPGAWVAPRRARIGWDQPASAFGGMRYDVAVDGIVRQRGHRGRGALLDPRGLGDGPHDVQVIAIDGAGQQTATSVQSVRVDVLPPTATAARVRRVKRSVLVTASDAASRVVRAATRISFGDGTRAVVGRARATHAYERAGRYRIRVVARDRVGHVSRLTLPVTVR